MLSDEAVKLLEKQQYRIVGKHKHSSVKVCGWTKNLIRGKGGCYKLKFYGIMSHQCLQMSTSMSCANRCVFCWRGYKAPVSKTWNCEVDEPDLIIDESLHAQQDLLNGFAGSKTANKKAIEESKTVKHVALSLTGEPITYPKINEIIHKFHDRKISTFLVTNAQYAEEIKNLTPVTQLYVSVDAPTKSLLKKIDLPLFDDFWERYLLSLDYLKEKTYRTTIRITLIKNFNMCNEKDYANLIIRGDPDFVEVKGYMFVGASRQRLKLENMPFHEEVEEFSKKLIDFLPGYSIASVHKPSRVVLFAKNKFFNKEKNSWETWIDFEKFFELEKNCRIKDENNSYKKNNNKKSNSQKEEREKVNNLFTKDYSVRFTSSVPVNYVYLPEEVIDEIDIDKIDIVKNK